MVRRRWVVRIGCVTATDAGASTAPSSARRKIAKTDQVGESFYFHLLTIVQCPAPPTSTAWEWKESRCASSCSKAEPRPVKPPPLVLPPTWLPLLCRRENQQNTARWQVQRGNCAKMNSSATAATNARRTLRTVVEQTRIAHSWTSRKDFAWTPVSSNTACPKVLVEHPALIFRSVTKGKRPAKIQVRYEFQIDIVLRWQYLSLAHFSSLLLVERRLFWCNWEAFLSTVFQRIQKDLPGEIRLETLPII